MSITAEQIEAGAAQLRALKGQAAGTVRDIQAHNEALEGIARALEARSAEGMRAHAARLDTAAAHVFVPVGEGARKVATRAIELSRIIARESA